ncbi:unnamed protein product [Lupinus luteus]|uniref:Trichome birefringence-like C-terminal domain-containing protein n=1 Tax=Lupinus luteus TaxID=3873 RepID=A0AAV1WWG9_LUPLU
MGFKVHNLYLLFLFCEALVVVSIVHQARAAKSNDHDNLFKGSWVIDPSYPLYESSTCPFIDPEFDGVEFLNRWRGKKIMFVGDSLSLNMWQSLSCMIHASVPNASTSYSRKKATVTFKDYGVTIHLHRTPYLVDIIREDVGQVLTLDSIKGGNAWLGTDMLIFNSWHWWIHTGKHKGWDYIRDGPNLVKDMDRLDAFQKGLTTWAKWVDQNVNPNKTKVFFQGISPTHLKGEEWNQPNKTCSGEQEPLPGSTYPAGLPPAATIVNNVLNKMKKPVFLLDITLLSQLRKDAHPSAYSGDHPGNDCSHWCLPGLPDTWNQLLYAALTI